MRTARSDVPFGTGPGRASDVQPVQRDFSALLGKLEPASLRGVLKVGLPLVSRPVHACPLASFLERVAPAALGVLLSLAFVAASLTQRAPHLLALAGVALMLGLTFGALNAGWHATNWMLIGLGTATFLSGWVRLSIFLKRHPLEVPA